MAEKSIKKNAFLNMTKTVMGLFFPLITFPYASRILLPEGIGKVNFANSIVGYFTLVASLGVHGYAVREAAKIRNDKDALSKFSKEIFTINMIATFLAYFFFIITLLLSPKLQNYKNLLLLASSTIVFNLLGLDWLYAAEEDYAYITIRSILFQIISLFILFIFVRTQDDYMQYAAMGIFSSVGANICNFIHSRKYINWTKQYALFLRPHIKSIFVFFGMALVTSIYTILDTSMLGYLSNDLQVGYYSAATKVNRMVLSVIIAATNVLLPRLSYYQSNNQKSDVQNLLNKSLRFTHFIAIPATCGLFVLAPPIIMVISGETYLPATLPMQVITPILCIIPTANIMGGQACTVFRKEKIILYAEIAGALSNVTCNLMLIPRYGALGAAIGTIVAEIIVTLIEFMFARVYFCLKEQCINIIQISISSFTMTVCLLFIRKHIQNNLVLLLVSIASGCIIYGIMLLILQNRTALECASIFLRKKKEN